MKLVVGLGNPGKKYEGTRHNAGYEALAELARQQRLVKPRCRFQGECLEMRDGSETVLLLCPTTYMNASGRSVEAAAGFYQLETSSILVVCDDFQLPLGKLRFRAKGSAGGQKGLADIIRHRGTDEVARLRIGIGSPPPGWDRADFVLSRFRDEEQATMTEAYRRAAAGILDWVSRGLEHCMNHYN